MKKKVGMIILIVVFVLAAWFVFSGFVKRPDVVLTNFSLAEEEPEKMVLEVMLTSSQGYVRDYSSKEEENHLYLTFYQTFGFFNSPLGKSNSYEVTLSPTCEEIYFYTGNKNYQKVLQKNKETGLWEMVSKNS